MSEYRGFGIREVQVRTATGYAVHDRSGEVLHRCGSESDARRFIDKLCDPDSRGVRT